MKPPVLKDQPVSQGQKTPDKKGAKAESQKNTPPPEQLTRALHQIESAIRELVNQQRAAQEKGPAQHEIKDLEAQDDMAFWAKLMFFATMVAVGLTGFGIWLIKRTLDETKVAAKHTEGMLDEAKKTTEAAHAAIRATDKTAERQLRAYVNVITATVRDLIVGEPVTGKIITRNGGQTPAYEVVNLYTLVIRPFPDHGEFDDPETGPHTREQPARFVLASNAQPVLPLKSRGPLQASEMQGIERGTSAIYIVGRITYQDIFQKPHHTNFRFMVGGDRGIHPTGIAWACEEGNEAD